MADPAAVATTFWDLKATEVLKFISGVISSVAWPIAAVIVLRLFRTELLKLIPFLSKVTVMGASLEFARKLDEAASKVAAPAPAAVPAPAPATAQPQPDQAAPPPSGKVDAVVGTMRPVSADLAASYIVHGAPATDPIALEANPAGVVMESWAVIEEALHSLAWQRLGFRGPPSRRPSIPELLNVLQKGDVITPAEVENVRDIHMLRNMAAHTKSITISDVDALRFKMLADSLVARLRMGALQASPAGAQQ